MTENSIKYSNKMKIFRLRFDTPVAGIVDSVKIYGAILHAMKSMYPNKFDDFYESIKNGKFRVSSLVPVINGEIYVPKPILPADLPIECRKEFKKSVFVPINTAKKAVEKGAYDHNLIKEVVDSYGNVSRCSKKEEIPKVSLKRGTMTPKLFYQEVKYLFKEWAVLSLVDEFEKEVISCFRFIGDRGLSKKVSWGFGKFRVVASMDFQNRISGNYAYLLSKFAPRSEELSSIDFRNSYFEIETVFGRTRTGHTFKQRAVKEGSCLKINASEKVKGKVLEMKVGDYIYSACFVPIFV